MALDLDGRHRDGGHGVGSAESRKGGRRRSHGCGEDYIVQHGGRVRAAERTRFRSRVKGLRGKESPGAASRIPLLCSGDKGGSRFDTCARMLSCPGSSGRGPRWVETGRWNEAYLEQNIIE